MVENLRLEATALHRQQREHERADDVRCEDDGPQPSHPEERPPVVAIDRDDHRVERVLGEELRAADDHRNEADGVEHRRHEPCPLAFTEDGERRRDAEPRQAHRDAGAEPRECEGARRALELVVRVALDALVDLRCRQAVGCRGHSAFVSARTAAETRGRQRKSPVAGAFSVAGAVSRIFADPHAGSRVLAQRRACLRRRLRVTWPVSLTCVRVVFADRVAP